MKPGYQTTEFWLTVLTALWAAVGAGVPPPWNVIVPTVGSGLYAIARGLAKAGVLRGSAGKILTAPERAEETP